MTDLSTILAERYEDAPPLPAECYLDPYHPNNSEFFKQQNTLKQLIVAQSREMKPAHVQFTKMLMLGMSNKDIALKLDIEQNTASRIKHREDVQKLYGLLLHLSALNEGPTTEHRKRMLYEIAVDNQKLEPKTSIAAVQEMNRMDGIGPGGKNTDTSINITINNDQLPRGDLDK